LLGELPADKARGALSQRCAHFARALVRVVDELVEDEAGTGSDDEGRVVHQGHLDDAGIRRADPLVVEHRLADLEGPGAGAGAVSRGVRREGGGDADAIRGV
jgi:hypothetical protein